MNLILASQSQQRKKIMAATFANFKVKPAEIDEYAIPFSLPIDKAEKIAVAKAQAVAERNQDSQPMIIIAADTFCLCRGKILEKPKDIEEAKKMLELQSGRKVKAFTGYAFLYINGQEIKMESGTDVVEARFRDLTSSEIEFYIKNNPVLTWSAAFSAAYDSGMAIISEVCGNLTSFTHGLPIDKVAKFVLSVDNEHNT